jgi:putative oxidoreductase
MFSTKFNDTLAGLGLLILRFVSGGMMLTHGYQKLMKLAELKSGFPDPLGVGHDISLYLTLFAELVCAALLLIGLFTRLALLPLLVTMIVAFFIIHAKDPLGDKELALFYLTAYTTLFFTGAGKYSMDKVVFKK